MVTDVILTYRRTDLTPIKYSGSKLYVTFYFVIDLSITNLSCETAKQGKI